MSNNIDYPTDFVLVDENKIRLTALSVLITGVVYIKSGHWALPAFLTIDFCTRAFNFSQYSLLNIFSVNLINFFSIDVNPVDEAPKRFAAKIGFILSICILFCYYLHFTTTTVILAIFLAALAFLEAVVGFCAGCYVYVVYRKLLKKK